jgi:hypothetical protein
MVISLFPLIISVSRSVNPLVDHKMNCLSTKGYVGKEQVWLLKQTRARLEKSDYTVSEGFSQFIEAAMTSLSSRQIYQLARLFDENRHLSLKSLRLSIIREIGYIDFLDYDGVTDRVKQDGIRRVLKC